MKENMMAKWQEYKVWISLGVMGLLIGSGLLLVYQPAQAEQVPDVLTLASTKASSKDEVPIAEKASDKVESKPQTIMVDVKGAVEQAGLYELSATSRVADAIDLAGGLTEQADPKSINLAQKLVDEAVVYVATKEEAISVVAASVAPSTSDKETADLVNLNTADASQLQTISGIGAKRAQDIIAYREANGPFKTVDDLNQVSGIGDKTLENLRSYVTVD
ncbi:helix-hairpin-helix domain-containing protein [Streptococcus ovuberis]|uniref:ComEA family DNA-binding protein n=1 Tax=Streptococcus ovuberis TaxID=1936207 RepID=A0A7X6S1C1_9STRE|nr:helix-hairpin-helix domain-containing protein [Streptococcus ovuberis]NKZ20026.1 ComEA family DNA-binding protein [Streptococcus ovuberis]